MQSEDPDRQAPRSGVGTRPRDREEPGSARGATLTVALTATFAFLLATAAGLVWLLSGEGPLSGAGDAVSGGSGEPAEPGDSAAGDAGGDTPAPEGTVEDPASGLSYRLPGEDWRRLGDDEVPPEYSSYAVYGSPDEPDAFIVTGSEGLGPAEPPSAAGARLALDALGGLVADPGSLRVEPSGPAEVDGSPAFEAAVSGGEESYGRFLLVETGDRKGGFVLGLSTGGGQDASDAIDEAFETVDLL
ncbi:hypothetical protein A6A08_14910 [Nocardiopsis sp. TSRI0078]|uniref:hypothetical protein n=1 Tax=unclassified Nocardiopsis TaxID=2649073 RepID=UPI00093EEF33|nr:hypothetical protein [Nocardiopsis sp. TSRI0078]OKI13745.1 hypothetical protein A6A08_14910 [Nocardiopsis sp. TSRI0078]